MLRTRSKMSQIGSSNTLATRHFFPAKRLNCSTQFPLASFLLLLIPYRFSKLERNGTARRIAAGYDLETVESFPDEEIEAALSSLENATLVITEQSSVMKLQRTAVNEFQAGNRQTQIQFKRTAGLRQRNRLQEKQNTDLAVISTKTLSET